MRDFCFSVVLLYSRNKKLEWGVCMYLYLSESLKNIRKSKLAVLLFVLLFSMMFLVEGYTYSYSGVISDKLQQGQDENLQKYTMYVFSSRLNSRMIQMAEPEAFADNMDIKSIKFYEELAAIDNLKFIIYDESILNIHDFKGDLNVFGSPEEGLEGFVMTLKCYPSFHKVENYRVIIGRDITDEDLVYEEGKPRPVLLGYKYKDVYKPGDILSISNNNGSYNSIVQELEVFGILDEDTVVMDKQTYRLYDLDNYILFPTVCVTEALYEHFLEPDDHNRDLSTCSLNYRDHDINNVKMYIPQEVESETVLKVQEALNNYSIFGKYYKIVNKNEGIEREVERNEALSQFHSSIAIVLIVFSVVTTIFSVTDKVNQNIKSYAIHILVGASKRSVVLMLLTELGLILLLSEIFGLALFAVVSAELYLPFDFLPITGLFTGSSLLILVISAVAVLVELRKFDIFTTIK